MVRPQAVDAAVATAVGLDLNAGELVEAAHRLIIIARERPVRATEFRSSTFARDALERCDEILAGVVVAGAAG